MPRPLRLRPRPAAAGAPRAGALVVVNQDGASAWLLDAATGAVLARLPTGVGPHEVAVSPDGHRAVVTDYGDRATVGASLTVLDLASHGRADRPPRRLRAPHGVAFLPDGRVAVTAERDSAVVVVDVEAGTVAFAAPTGQAASHLLALSPDGRYAFTGNILSGRSRRSTSPGAGQTPSRPSAPSPRRSPSARTAGRCGRPARRRAASWPSTPPRSRRWGRPIGGGPYRIAFTPDGARALVTTSADALHVLDARTRQPVGVVSFAPGPVPPGSPSPPTAAGRTSR